MKTSRSYVFALGTAALFSGSYVAARYTTLELGPLTTSFLRYSVGLVFLIFFGLYTQQLSFKFPRADLLEHLCLGIFGIVGFHYFFFMAVGHTHIANTAIINAFSPVMTGVLASIFIRERLSTRNYVGLGIALGGVLLLLSKGDPTNILKMDVNAGDGFMVAAVLCWAIYSLIIRKQATKYSGFTLTLHAVIVGVTILFFMALSEGWWNQAAAMSTHAAISVVYMGIGASGIGYLLYNTSIAKIGPTKTSAIVYSSSPLFVALLAWYFFGEVVTIIMVISAILILAGVYLAILPDDVFKNSNKPPRLPQ